MPVRLFVDDRRHPPDNSWHLCRTITEAQRILSTQEVEEISLDHDIEWNCNPNHEDDRTRVAVFETYMAIAYFLALLPADRRPGVVNLHSGSTGARENMEEVLKKAGYQNITQTTYGF